MSRTMKARITGHALAVAVLAAVAVSPPAAAGMAPAAFFNPTSGNRNVALIEAGAALSGQSSGSPSVMLDFSTTNGSWTTSGITNQFVKVLLAGASSTPWVVDRIQLRPFAGGCCPTNRVKSFAIDVSITDAADASFTNVLAATAADSSSLQEFVLPQPARAKYVRYRPLSTGGSTTSIQTNQLRILTGQQSASATVTFSNLSTDAEGDITSYLWDFGDGTTSTDASPVHTFPAPGPYTVTLTATDLEGNVGTFTAVQRVLSPPAVSFTFSPPDPTEATSVQFCDTSTDADGGIIQRTWAWGDTSPSTVTTATCVNHTFGDNATYTVTLTVVDSQEQTASGSRTVTPTNVPPAVNVGADRSWVTGERLVFGVTISDGGFRDTRTCVWDHGDGTTRNVCGSFDHAYATPAVGFPARTFTASLTATDDDGGVGSDSLDVTVYPQMFQQIPSAAVDAIGVDWSRLVNRLVVTRGGTCVNSLALVSLDGTSTPPITSDLNPTTCAEAKLAVSAGGGGFATGDVFLGNGNVGQIVRVRMNADGTVAGVDSPWATLSGTTSGRPNGGLAFDDAGGFGGDLLAALSDGRVYRIASDGTSSLVANFNRLLEGADVAGPGFGPASGCLLTTDGSSKRLLAACPGGSTMTVATIPTSSSLVAPAFVPSAGDLFYGNPSADTVYRGDARAFTGQLAGHTLVATLSGGEIWDVSYDAAAGAYQARLLTLAVHGGTVDPIEQLAFVPALASPGTSLAPAAATALVGDAHTVTATILDASGNPVEGLQLTFDVVSGPNAGATGAATTDAAGHASFTYAGPAGPGTDAIVARSSSAVTAPAQVTWVLRSSVLEAAPALAAVSVPGGAQAVLGPRATLSDKTTGAPVAGRTVEFYTTDPTTGMRVLVCTATTDASGAATCGGPVELVMIVAGQSYEALFGGDNTYAASGDTAPLVSLSLEE